MVGVWSLMVIVGVCAPQHGEDIQYIPVYNLCRFLQLHTVLAHKKFQ